MLELEITQQMRRAAVTVLYQLKSMVINALSIFANISTHALSARQIMYTAVQHESNGKVGNYNKRVRS